MGEKLALEPEHLAERVLDLLDSLGASHKQISMVETMQVDDDGDAGMDTGELAAVDFLLNGVICRVLVREQGDESPQISCTRLNSDTFEFHRILRQIKTMFDDPMAAALRH